MGNDVIITPAIISQVEKFLAAGNKESNTEASTARITPTQKDLLPDLATSIGYKGESTLLRDALNVYFFLLPHLNRIRRNPEATLTLIGTLS